MRKAPLSPLPPASRVPRPAGPRESGGYPGLRAGVTDEECCTSFLHRISFHSVPSSPPPGCLLRRDPDSRVTRAGARARGRAFRGGAVCAPDCPCLRPRATGRAPGAPLLSARSGSFRAGAKRGGIRTAASVPPAPIWRRPAGISSLNTENYHYCSYFRPRAKIGSRRVGSPPAALPGNGGRKPLPAGDAGRRAGSGPAASAKTVRAVRRRRHASASPVRPVPVSAATPPALPPARRGPVQDRTGAMSQRHGIGSNTVFLPGV